jgi:hypothetical protein
MSNHDDDMNVDKFYTIPAISEKCLNRVGERYDWSTWDVVVEPSAGGGSFFTRIPTDKKIGLDISPTHKEILKQDFLTYELLPPPPPPPPQPQYADTPQRRILVVGNPPFGRVSSLAVKFFNHASNWANVIAFIVPRTFRRISLQNKLNTTFHLVFDEDIPMEPCSFEPPMMAKCCFQIWEKSETIRRPIVQLSTVHADWEFLGFGPNDAKGQPTPPTGSMNEEAKTNIFALRAYGGKCGQIVDTGLDSLRPKSWHWIKSKIPKQILIERFSLLDYSVSLDTARQNSIGRGELVHLYSDAYDAPDAPDAHEIEAPAENKMLVADHKHEDVVRTVSTLSMAIPFNVTFLHTIQNYGFGNVPNNVCIRHFKDGRNFSPIIEPWLEQNYPSLKWIGGCKGHDLEDIADENIKYEQKTFTKGGCKFMPSNMIGVGRKFDQTIFEEKTKKLIFIIVGNIDFPNIKIKFVRGTDLLVNYPDGKIPLKDFDKFFN